ncbi:MAG: diguanylate cyclase, partial [Nitrosospira sp.]
MISDHNPALIPSDKPSTLETTLEKNQEVKDKIENCAAELSMVAEAVKTEIAAGSTLHQVEETLIQNENVGEKILECADELREIGVALAREIDGRDEINRELLQTGELLTVTQNILSETQEVLAGSERATEGEKERLRVTLDHIGDAVITTDMGGNITYINRVAETMTGWSSREAQGHPLREVFNTVDSKINESAPNSIELIVQEKTDVGLALHTVLIQRSGNTFNIEDLTAPIRDNHGTIIGAVLIFHDVTQAQDMAVKMSHLASHDALTGLINRREFERRLEHALRTGTQDGKQHTLMNLDLDQFKIVNDTCGYMAGDELLKQLTGILQAQLRTNDTLARVGGDEFGL